MRLLTWKSVSIRSYLPEAVEYLINNDMKQIEFVRIDYLEATREFILKGMVSLSHNDASRTFQNMVFFF
jgi:hypothetical protein